jgi:hypothetical protein
LLKNYYKNSKERKKDVALKNVHRLPTKEACTKSCPWKTAWEALAYTEFTILTYP